jgi:hypothetical protein
VLRGQGFSPDVLLALRSRRRVLLRRSTTVSVLVELACQPVQFRRANVAFLARVLDGLAGHSQPSRCVHHIQYTFRHDRQTFVRGHVACRQIATVYHDPLRFPTAEPRIFGDGEMHSRRIHVGDPIHAQRGFMRERDLLGAMTRARPQDRFPVLRQPIGGKVRNAIDLARDPFQLPSLRKSGQYRIPDTQGTGLACRNQAIILLREVAILLGENACSQYGPLLASCHIVP